MDYKQFQVQDFLADEFFVSWVLNEDAVSSHFWEKWLNANPEKRGDVEQAKEIIRSVNYRQTNRLSDDEYSAIFEKLIRVSQNTQSNNHSGFKKYAFRIAASIIFILVALFLYQREPDVIVASTDFKIVKTEFGQRRTIRLPDGSTVKLNAGSSIEYPEVFGKESRIVELFGEAYFEVTENKAQPFIIHSGGLTTEVIGTSFNLSAYPEMDSIKVAVVSGMVKISNNEGGHQVLSPTDMGVFSKQSKSILRRKFEADILAWAQGILVIENKPLPQVFDMLGRWYGVEFQIKDGVNLTGTYSGRYQNKSLELVLQGISYTSHLKYSMNNNKILIYE